MNFPKIIYARTFQLGLRAASYFLNFSRPKTYLDLDVISAIEHIANVNQLMKFLLVTDRGLVKTGLVEQLKDEMTARGYQVVIYDETVANPTIENIESALKLYYETKCQAIIGFGGGSPLDCAKGVAARLARPRRKIPQLRGLLKIGRRRTTLIAIPTTAGTGSEATLAAVITDSNTKEKYAINDTHLIPDFAVLDAKLTVNLPAHITASTGMDALTHAIEAFIGRANTRLTKQSALTAIRLIHEYLLEAYNNPTNLVARRNMQIAALEAGVAFTRAYVGHVHAIAHQLGGFYQVPHGLANAVILPQVLDQLLPSCYQRLAMLAKHLKLIDVRQSPLEHAQAFIAWIRLMNDKMNLTNSFGHLINQQDVDIMASRAYKEAFPLYPVPKLWDKKQYQMNYEMLLKKE